MGTKLMPGIDYAFLQPQKKPPKAAGNPSPFILTILPFLPINSSMCCIVPTFDL